MPKKPIDSFTGDFAWLSNFYTVPVRYGRITYPTLEHAFQAAKTQKEEERIKILEAETPAQAKRLGRKVTLRAGWDESRVRAMALLLKRKFEIPHLAAKLGSTKGRELIEGNWWGDVFWGVCDGRGKNKLGKLLMELREELLCE